jgi:hypothetical protein
VMGAAMYQSLLRKHGTWHEFGTLAFSKLRVKIGPLLNVQIFVSGKGCAKHS